MKLARNTPAKLIAAILAILSLAACTVSVILATVIFNYSGYEADTTADALAYRMSYSDMLRDMDQAADYYAMTLMDTETTRDALSFYKKHFSKENTNFFFTVNNFDNDKVLLSNYTDEYSYRLRMDFYVAASDYFVDSNVTYDMASDVIYFYDDMGNRTAEYHLNPDSDSTVSADAVGESALNDIKHVTVYGHLRKNLSSCYDDYAKIYYLANELHSRRFEFIIIAAVAGVVCVISLVFLFYGAGRRKGTDEIFLRLIDLVPWDIFLVLCGGLACGGVMLFFLGFEFLLYQSFSRDTLLLIAAASLPAAALVVLFLTSFAARFKAKGWWKNSIIVGFFLWLGALLHHPLRGLVRLIRDIPLIWKTVLILIPVPFVEFACLACFYDNIFFPIVLFNLVILFIVLSCAVQMQKLRLACKAIADGDQAYRVDTRRLFLDFRAHGEDLNRIGSGISVAVEERLKSERFKTELITNVSHDLKTPLTSIINYVDLLSKLELPEEAQGYVEVLRRQSARLKKLTEDLVEASKASTGTLSVEISAVDLNELVNQVCAEYGERLEKSGLACVTTLPDLPLAVLGDGRYLWRIMDNLLSNVCKYALFGTRVYIDAQCQNGAARITVKNISRERLNVSADQLMDRFVRGDTSRNTEGSGLGLSIAQSLAQLMGGKLTLTVDGDLFKAEVTLPMA